VATKTKITEKLTADRLQEQSSFQLVLEQPCQEVHANLSGGNWKSSDTGSWQSERQYSKMVGSSLKDGASRRQ